MRWWQYINQLSFFLISATAAAAIWFLTRRFGAAPRIALLVVFTVVAGAFMLSRQTPDSEDGVITSAAQLESALDGSSPVALEFFSNF